MTPQLREALIAVDALLRRGEARAAAAMLERIALESPDAAQSAELQLLLGQASFQDGEWAAAERAVGKAIELRPALAEAHRLMGLVLAELDRLDEAASRFEHALLLHPRHGRTCANLGLVERRMGRLPEAQSHFREAVEIDRTYAPAWRGLAETLQAAGGDEEAIAAWRSWWALQTDRAEANTTLGAAFARMHRWHDAETALSLAVQSKVADAGAAMQLGFVRRERGDIDGAIAAYELAAGQSKALAPRIAKALVLPQVYRDGADLRTWRQRYEDGVTELEQSSATMGATAADFWALDWSNFYLAYQGENDRALQQRYANLISRIATSADDTVTDAQPAPSGKRRLRIGFASSFFRRCTVAAYFGAWITDLDRDSFETFLFHFGSEADATTRMLQARVDHSVLVHGGVRRIAAKIREARLDVLLYPQSGMDGRDATLAALRLAPVQCAAWGHPVTTGSSAIDYYFTCADMEPPDASLHYSERVLMLPGLGTSYADPGCRAATRAEFGLPDGLRLYACPQSLFKIHPDNDAMFADLLMRDPGGRVVFCAQPGEPATLQFQARIRGVMEAGGLDHNRILWQPLRAGADFRAMLSVCDVLLDTLHWSGGNTSLDALAAGLPIVTCPGRFLRGRQSAAMLRTLGLERLVADNPASAVERAIAVATDSSAFRTQVHRASGQLFSRPEPLLDLQRHLLRITDRDT